jgi:hemerythrin
MAISWREDLATGIAVVDSQHKKIFARFDAFSDACSRGVGKDELIDVLRFLRTYTEQHFRDEEDYMAGTVYPELAAQKKAHRKFP